MRTVDNYDRKSSGSCKVDLDYEGFEASSGPIFRNFPIPVQIFLV